MIRFQITGLDALRRKLSDIEKKQLPFATARALTVVARKVQATETAMLPQLLDRPTPFTMRAYAVTAATKANPTATVQTRPIQGQYLAPEEYGLPQFVRNKAVAEPVDLQLNSYGNIPRGTFARLKGRPDIFIGTVKGIGGVWQRVGPPSERARKTGRYRGRPPIAAKPQALRLLIRFADPVPVKTRLGFTDRALALVRREIAGELTRHIDAAVKTAKP